MYHYLLELVSSWQKCSLDPFLCKFHFDRTQYTTVSSMRREQFCKRLINVVKASKFNIDRLKNGPTKHFENSPKKLHFFQRLMGGMNCWGRSHCALKPNVLSSEG
jgi:hypothetical protein